jgi:pyruvate/2-oxoglutarate dehydrogenase complex dihydrolipoamide acyltransferase (E2) component
MIYKLVVPGPVEDVEEVRVLEWHGSVGRVFSAGELVVELETHKAIIEVRAAQPGILRGILCAAGDWQRIGEPLAVLSDNPSEPVPKVAGESVSWLVEFEIT